MQELKGIALMGFGLSGDDAENALEVWIISPSLHLQMKEHHQPFKVMKKWPELLDTYTNPDPYGELPGVYLKRGMMFHQGLEREVKDPAVVKLLYEELMFNVQYSLYPAPLDSSIKLAALGLQVALDGRQEPAAAMKKHFKAVAECQRPPHLKRDIADRAWRSSVLEAYAAAPRLASAGDRHQACLRIGYKLPFYGSTFFYGHIEASAKKVVVRETPDILVRVGVNIEGILVVRDSNGDTLLSLRYDELRYNSYSASDESPDASFLIEWDDHEQGTKEEMVIWTPQATMIDTLVSNLVAELPEWHKHNARDGIEKVKSFKPSKLAKGRRSSGVDEDGSGGGTRSYFTLSRTLNRHRPRSGLEWEDDGAAGGGGAAVAAI